MVSTTVYDNAVSFVYGEETRHAVVSYKGKALYIGPFPDKQSAIERNSSLSSSRMDRNELHLRMATRPGD